MSHQNILESESALFAKYVNTWFYIALSTYIWVELLLATRTTTITTKN